MKNIAIILSILLLWSYTIMAQNDCKEDTALYLAAYQYIINDSVNQNKEISVSNFIVDLDRFFFSEDLQSFPVEKEKVDQFRENKGFSWFESYYSYCIDSLFCKKQQANSVLFFSQIEDNMLRVDVLPRKRCFDKFDYDTLAFQTVGRNYLFIFDEDDTIKIVLSHKMIYD